MSNGPYKRAAKPGSFPAGLPVAIEYDGDQYPALVGVIIALFTAIERELPDVIARITRMNDEGDAWAICSVLRSFNTQIEILDALLKRRDGKSHDKIIYSHCKELFSE